MRKEKPMYRIIMDDLKEQIRNRNFDYNVPIATEQTLMKKYSVSRITAMRALEELDKAGIIYRKRGIGSFVTSSALFDVEEEAADSSPTVISPKAEGTVSIAMVIPVDVKHTNIMEYFSGASEVINSRGYVLNIYNSCRNTEKEAQILRDLIAGGVDGIICCPYLDNYNAEIYNFCVMSGIAFVLVDKYVEGIPIPHVVSDNYSGTKRLTERIINKGHRKIAFVSELSVGDVTSVKGRYTGYIDALTEHNILPDIEIVKVKLCSKYEDLCRKKHLKKEDYHYNEYLTEQVIELYRLGVTAVVCENDWIAMQIIRICRTLGISVPDAMSVAGFDNVSRVTPIDAELMTVEQDFLQIGRTAAEIICSRIENGAVARIRTRNVIPVKIINGTTVKSLI